MIQIAESELEELKRKAALYDKIVSAGRSGALARVKNTTPEQRKEWARKALEARKRKLGY